MNPQELELFIALQGVIKEKMGAIQVGDNIYNERYLDGIITETHHPAYLKIWFDLCGVAEWYFRSMPLTRLPLPIDPSGQGRGLVDMINGTVRLIRTYALREWVIEVYSENDKQLYNAATPTLALLKAIAAQEGIKVK